MKSDRTLRAMTLVQSEQSAQLVAALLTGLLERLALLLLLDEPMAGMGPDESENMVALLQGLRGDTTILLVEHDMDAVFRLADTISTLVFGKVIASGTAQQIKDNPDVRRAYLGDEAILPAAAH